jgi:hypothetical protein
MSKLPAYPEILLALDPGDTTGAAIFRNGNLPSKKGVGQVVGDVGKLAAFIRRVDPDMIVAEDFVLYAHRARDQSWDSMQTSRLLGAIELVCHDLKCPFQLQTAQDGKAFPTDAKLRAWNVMDTSRRHGMDAVRHGVTYLIFGHPSNHHLKYARPWLNGGP